MNEPDPQAESSPIQAPNDGVNDAAANDAANEAPTGLYVRPFRVEDLPRVRHLYASGLLAGQPEPNDTGADIDNIQEAYLDSPRNAFWVAALADEVVGMIGVAEDGHDVAEIRRLRVDPAHQTGEVSGLLLECAVAFCRDQEYLKVRLDTRFDTDAALEVFDRIGFQHTRTKPTDEPEKELLEFYLDLYRPSTEEESSEG